MKPILQQQPGQLLESDRNNEAKRLKSMDLSFEFGCSLIFRLSERKWNWQMWYAHQKKWQKC